MEAFAEAMIVLLNLMILMKASLICQQMGIERERERGERAKTGRGTTIEYSIFVENLPYHQNPIHLGRLFSRYGRVVDVYIPRKVAAKTRRRFGFVRYKLMEEAQRAVRGMNGAYIYQHRISVAWARFQKSEKRSKTKKGRYRSTYTRRKENSKQQWIWVPKVKENNTATVVQMNQEGPKGSKDIFEVQGEVCEEVESWLKRSLVCVTDHPRDPSSLANTLMYELPMCLKVTDMGLFKFILTFESSDEGHKKVMYVKMTKVTFEQHNKKSHNLLAG